MERKKRKAPKHLTLEDVDYEVSNGDTFLIEMKDMGEDVTLLMEKPKRRRKR